MKLFVVFLLFTIPVFASEKMTLDQCVHAALENNQNLKALDAKLESANLQVKNSQTAYLPRLDFGAYYQYISAVSSIPSPLGAISFGDHDADGVSGNASEMLFDGGQAHFRMKSLQRSHESAIANRQSSAEDVAINISRLYFGILGMEKAKKTLELEDQTLADTRKDAQHRLEAGLLLQVDLLAIDLQAATLKKRVEDLSNNIETLHLRLLNVMAMPLDKEIELVEDSTAVVPPAKNAGAFDPSRKSSVFALSKQIEAGNYRVRSLGGSFLPSITARGSYYYENPGIDKIQNEWMDYWTAGINLNWTLWDFGTRSRDRQAARFDNRALEENLNFASEQARLQYQEASLNLESSNRQTTLSQQSVDLANKKLQWTRDRYGSGLATSSDLITAVNEWESARLAEVKSVIDLRLNELELKYAAGDILK